MNCGKALARCWVLTPARRRLALPFTIKREKFGKDAEVLLKAYDDNAATALIVGYPINMDGSHGPRAQSVRDFCTNLLRLRDMPIFLWDERMSTMAVTRTMLEADMSRKKRAENVDKLAASYILQGVLDRLACCDNYYHNLNGVHNAQQLCPRLTF